MRGCIINKQQTSYQGTLAAFCKRSNIFDVFIFYLGSSWNATHHVSHLRIMNIDVNKNRFDVRNIVCLTIFYHNRLHWVDRHISLFYKSLATFLGQYGSPRYVMPHLDCLKRKEKNRKRKFVSATPNRSAAMQIMKVGTHL